MIKYIKDLIPQYLNGDKARGHSPLRYSEYYGRKITAMSYEGDNLYSYDTLIGKLDAENYILYLTDARYSATTTRQLNDTAQIALNCGYKVIMCNPEDLKNL